MDVAFRDKIVLLLTNGMTVEAAEGFCIRQGKDPEDARRIVSEARQRITVAADYARDEQLGKAVMRLDDLYAKSIAAQDTRTALQAQRELNRLLSLYSAADSDKSLAPPFRVGASPCIRISLAPDQAADERCGVRRKP